MALHHQSTIEPGPRAVSRIARMANRAALFPLCVGAAVCPCDLDMLGARAATELSRRVDAADTSRCVLAT